MSKQHILLHTNTTHKSVHFETMINIILNARGLAHFLVLFGLIRNKNLLLLKFKYQMKQEFNLGLNCEKVKCNEKSISIDENQMKFRWFT